MKKRDSNFEKQTKIKREYEDLNLSLAQFPLDQSKGKLTKKTGANTCRLTNVVFILCSFLGITAIGMSVTCGYLIQTQKVSNKKFDSDVKKEIASLTQRIEDLKKKFKESDKKYKNRIFQFKAANIFQNCYELRNSGVNKSGVYNISVSMETVAVYCDMETDGGGWTVIQKRINGNISFSKNSSDYETGFGNKNGEHWLGLKTIRELTRKQGYELRIDMGTSGGRKSYVKYNLFRIAPPPSYAITVNYTEGPTGNPIENNAPFVTSDRTYGYSKGSTCSFSVDGGWWYTTCYQSNLNGQYANPPQNNANGGIIWKGLSTVLNLITKTEMKIRPIQNRVFL